MRKARNGGDSASAAAIEVKMRDLITTAARDGHINNAAAFKKSITDQIIARNAAELSAILSLPKRLRGQYAPSDRSNAAPPPIQQ